MIQVDYYKLSGVTYLLFKFNRGSTAAKKLLLGSNCALSGNSFRTQQKRDLLFHLVI